MRVRLRGTSVWLEMPSPRQLPQTQGACGCLIYLSVWCIFLFCRQWMFSFSALSCAKSPRTAKSLLPQHVRQCLLFFSLWHFCCSRLHSTHVVSWEICSLSRWRHRCWLRFYGAKFRKRGCTAGSWWKCSSFGLKWIIEWSICIFSFAALMCMLECVFYDATY